MPRPIEALVRKHRVQQLRRFHDGITEMCLAEHRVQSQLFFWTMALSTYMAMVEAGPIFIPQAREFVSAVYKSIPRIADAIDGDVRGMSDDVTRFTTTNFPNHIRSRLLPSATPSVASTALSEIGTLPLLSVPTSSEDGVDLIREKMQGLYRAFRDQVPEMDQIMRWSDCLRLVFVVTARDFEKELPEVDRYFEQASQVATEAGLGDSVAETSRMMASFTRFDVTQLKEMLKDAHAIMDNIRDGTDEYDAVFLKDTLWDDPSGVLAEWKDPPPALDDSDSEGWKQHMLSEFSLACRQLSFWTKDQSVVSVRDAPNTFVLDDEMIPHLFAEGSKSELLAHITAQTTKAADNLRVQKRAYAQFTTLRTFDEFSEDPNARGHQDACTKFMLSGCFAVDHNLTDAALVTCLQRSGEIKAVGTSGSRLNEFKSWMKERQTKTQHHTLQWCYHRVLLLVRMTGGPETWAATSRDHRRAIFEHLFNSAPLAICREMHSPKLAAVSFEQIWAVPESVGHVRAWRAFFREVFVQLCEDTWSLAVAFHIGHPEHHFGGELRQAMYKEMTLHGESLRQKLSDSGLTFLDCPCNNQAFVYEMAHSRAGEK